MPWIALAMFGSGIAFDIFGVLWTTTIQREVPEAALSRVSSYDWFGSLAFAPLGLLIAGPVAARIGVGPALTGCAALIVLASAAALLSPQVRRVRTPEWSSTGREADKYGASERGSEGEPTPDSSHI